MHHRNVGIQCIASKLACKISFIEIDILAGNYENEEKS